MKKSLKKYKQIYIAFFNIINKRKKNIQIKSWKIWIYKDGYKNMGYL